MSDTRRTGGPASTDEFDVLALTATGALAALETGALSVHSYVGRLLAEAERRADLNAFVALNPDRVLAAADKADAQRRAGESAGLPLLGLPFCCKDNIETTELPTAAGTPALEGRPAGADAPVVERLRDAGALLHAKTVMHELGIGVTGNNLHLGPVRNPHAHDRVAGGSSAGTAAAVAAGLCPVGLATDTGGSARIPAALCGIVGYRPTHGRYPQGGVVLLSPTRDTVGLIARAVEDVALLDAVLRRGPMRSAIESEASRGAGAPVRPRTDERARPGALRVGPSANLQPLRGCRFGIPRRHFYEDLAHDVAVAVENLLERLEAVGVELCEMEIEGVDRIGEEAGIPVSRYESRRELARFTGGLPDLDLERLTARVVSPDVRAILTGMLFQPVTEEEYRGALARLADLRRSYSRAFASQRVEALLFPTTPLPAPPIGDDETTLHNARPVPVFPTLSRNTAPGSLAGLPGLTVPLPVTGLPVGIELDGPPESDRRLLALGAAVERVLWGCREAHDYA